MPTATTPKLEVRMVHSRLLNLCSHIQQHLNDHSVNPDDSKFQYNTKPVSESAKNRREQVVATFDQSWAALDKLLGHASTQDVYTQPGSEPKVVDSIEHVFSEVQAHAHWFRSEHVDQVSQGDSTPDDEEVQNDGLD
jgi:hypothetical protein